MATPILVTGAAGRVGAVGRTVAELLLKQGKAVRAMVRSEDARAQALRAMSAEVMAGDLLDLESMHRVIAGCETMYFAMSVSDAYLAATVNAAAVAKHHDVKAFINMSQMTVSQMSISETTQSPQHKLHWLAEQALNWSGLPVVHVRPTVFLEGFFLLFTADFVRESNQIRLPFGDGKTSPVAAADVARVVATLLRSAAAYRQGLSPERPTIGGYAFLCPGVFEGAGPHDHLPGYSDRAMAGRATQAWLAAPPGKSSRDDGGSSPPRPLRPDVRRRAHAYRARTVAPAGVCQKKCGKIHPFTGLNGLPSSQPIIFANP
jgi:uncharacterized protein YbjT (DUF2867 family)